MYYKMNLVNLEQLTEVLLVKMKALLKTISLKLANKFLLLLQKKHVCLVGIIAIFGLSTITSCRELTIKVNGNSSNTETKGLIVKAYIENSGSMDGYMRGGSEFKDAVYSYLSSLNNYVKAIQLNYINSQVVPLSVKMAGLVGQLNPVAFKKQGGNRSNSDFKKILSDVVNNANDNTVVVFVSDCILDIPFGRAGEELGIIQTDINNIITSKLKKMPSLGICIFQLESMFDGFYYYPKGGSLQLKGKRPYYMWIIGSQKNLAYLMRHVGKDKIQHGVKNYYAISKSFTIPTVLYSGGKMQSKQKLKTERDGKYSCKVLMDLTQTLQDNNYLSNIQNYSSKAGDVIVESVVELPLTNEYSHMLNLKVSNSAFSDVLEIKKCGIPSWVEVSNGTSDSTLEKDKTFSLKYIIGGVFDAYSKYTEAGKSVFTVNNH